MYAIFADVILALHFLFVVFVVAGLIFIWCGYFFSWKWVRNFYFRLFHIVAMGFVLLQTLLGRACPLTLLEVELRLKAGDSDVYPGTFLGYWLEQIMYFNFPWWVFAVVYSLFFLAIILSIPLVPPELPPRLKKILPMKAE